MVAMPSRRLGSPFFSYLLSALAIIVVIALASSSIKMSQSDLHVLEESGNDERATENSFFDSLAAKDAAKSNDASDISVNGRAKHSKQTKTSQEARSFRGQFALAKEQLEKAKAKMHRMEEKDRVQAEKQTMKMERVSAHEQAIEYEQHLHRLSDSVFPSSSAALEDPADAVRDALVDDIHTSSKSAIASLKAKARRTISHAQAARRAASAAPMRPANTAAAAPSSSIMDTVRQAGEALEKGASDALFSHSSSAAGSAQAAARVPRAAKSAATAKAPARSGAATARKSAATGKR